MTTTTFTEHPPVPRVLQEALKDYPELIAELQESLNGVGVSPGMDASDRTDQFEKAIWRLEADLGDYMITAAEEVRAAEATGDAALIAKAREKKMLMNSCRGRKLRQSYSELSDFFRRGQN